MHNYSKNWSGVSPLEFQPSRWLSLTSINEKSFHDDNTTPTNGNDDDKFPDESVDDDSSDIMDDDLKKKRSLYLNSNVTTIGSYMGWGPTPVLVFIYYINIFSSHRRHSYTFIFIHHTT